MTIIDGEFANKHITIPEIKMMTDVQEIEDLRSDLESSVLKIEADLEYSDRDDAWASRAIYALAHKRGQIKACGKRIDALKRRAETPAPTNNDATIEKAKAAAEKSKAVAVAAEAQARIAEAKSAANAAHVERLRLDRQKAIEDNFKRGVALIENTSFDRAFYRAARKILPSDIFEIIEETARNKVASATASFVENYNRTVETAQ